MHAPNWNMPPGWKVKQALLPISQYQDSIVVQSNYYNRRLIVKWEIAFYWGHKDSMLVTDHDIVFWKVKSFKSSPKT